MLGLAAVVLAESFAPGGPRLLEVVSPRPGARVGVEGIEVLVRFSPQGVAAPETFRALLNGADVTEALTAGENGAYGWLHGVLDGENVLRFEIFGRAPWRPGRFFEQSREVRLLVRPPLAVDRG